MRWLHRHKFLDKQFADLYLVRDYYSEGHRSRYSAEREAGKESSPVTLVTQQCGCGTVRQWTLDGHVASIFAVGGKK